MKNQIILSLYFALMVQLETVAHQCDNNVFHIFKLQDTDWGYINYISYETYDPKHPSISSYNVSINKYYKSPVLRIVIKRTPKEIWLRLLIDKEYRESACLWLIFLMKEDARILYAVHDNKETRDWYFRNQTIYWIKRFI